MMVRMRMAGIVAAIMLQAVVSGNSSQNLPPDRPNIIFIVSDDCKYCFDHSVPVFRSVNHPDHVVTAVFVLLHRNFVILAVGFNDVSFHGSQQIPTPNIDSLAKGGVILHHYYVQPVCSPTRATFMTGRSVIHTGPTRLILNAKETLRVAH